MTNDLHGALRGEPVCAFGFLLDYTAFLCSALGTGEQYSRTCVFCSCRLKRHSLLDCPSAEARTKRKQREAAAAQSADTDASPTQTSGATGTAMPVPTEASTPRDETRQKSEEDDTGFQAAANFGG
eukprot:SAG31_NODE_11520_length_1021_cov_1.655098_1_plen_125_part_10